ncbi:hypothetical protein GCM10010371_00520 [Streptomyces subrutilus]|uniref:YihY/virulence factor BrkB family protein n=1 Tax=Streptomyces subrutilus TaxID=36818 RepID=A0A5P2UDZ8_9ACTN|nr:hypothetical protein [Streptomyces subrutilus]QEU77198.1 hypothetical protein CP968_01830 [Streptomyces subrutilus]GGZ45448.1 hypothetical protein GCM10010371_00520 [Streptomyces subrutilus]
MPWRARLQDLRAGTEQRFPVVSKLTGRLLSTNLPDGATRPASQAFLASVPLLFAVAAFAPQGVRDQMRDSLGTVFGLTGQAKGELRKLLESLIVVCAGVTFAVTIGAPSWPRSHR